MIYFFIYVMNKFPSQRQKKKGNWYYYYLGILLCLSTINHHVIVFMKRKIMICLEINYGVHQSFFIDNFSHQPCSKRQPQSKLEREKKKKKSVIKKRVCVCVYYIYCYMIKCIHNNLDTVWVIIITRVNLFFHILCTSHYF